MKAYKYKISARKGFKYYTLKLHVKIWFFWWLVEGWKLRIGNEFEVEKQISEWVGDYNIPEERVTLKL